MSATLRFCPEVRFYSRLGISYGYGTKLRRLGIIQPSAFLDSDAPLFEFSEESFARQRERIRQYQASIIEAKRNAFPIPA